MHFPLAAALRRAALALAVAATLAPVVTPPLRQGRGPDRLLHGLRVRGADAPDEPRPARLGKSSLKVDQFLVSLARDRQFKCPSNGNTYRGRARTWRSGTT